jgi:hypothetical protein
VIVRILSEGQFDVDEAHLAHIEELDEAMFAAIEGDDEEAFNKALEGVLEAVRTEGKPVDPDEILPSDLVVPHAGATLAEIRTLLASDEAELQAPGEAARATAEGAGGA